jgi:ubiquitin-protein ligase
VQESQFKTGANKSKSKSKSSTQCDPKPFPARLQLDFAFFLPPFLEKDDVITRREGARLSAFLSVLLLSPDIYFFPLFELLQMSSSASFSRAFRAWEDSGEETAHLSICHSGPARSNGNPHKHKSKKKRKAKETKREQAERRGGAVFDLCFPSWSDSGDSSERSGVSGSEDSGDDTAKRKRGEKERIRMKEECACRGRLGATTQRFSLMCPPALFEADGELSREHNNDDDDHQEPGRKKKRRLRDVLFQVVGPGDADDDDVEAAGWIEECNSALRKAALELARARLRPAAVVAVAHSSPEQGEADVTPPKRRSMLSRKSLSSMKHLLSPQHSKQAGHGSSSPSSPSSASSTALDDPSIPTRELCLPVGRVLSVIASSFLEADDDDDDNLAEASSNSCNTDDAESTDPVENWLEESLDDDSDGMAVSGEDGFELGRDLDILALKKRWLAREREIREAVDASLVAKNLDLVDPVAREAESEAELDAESDPKYAALHQSKAVEFSESVFSQDAATRVLVNDLLRILDRERRLGAEVTAVDDNIFHWRVRLLPKCFSAESSRRQFDALADLHGFDFVELDVNFVMGLHPFYPPSVRLVRPFFVERNSRVDVGYGCLPVRVSTMPSLRPSLDPKTSTSSKSNQRGEKSARKSFDPCADMMDIFLEIASVIDDFFEHGGEIDTSFEYATSRTGMDATHVDLPYLVGQLELLTHVNESSSQLRAVPRLELKDAKRGLKSHNSRLFAFGPTDKDSAGESGMSSHEVRDFVEIVESIVSENAKEDAAADEEKKSKGGKDNYWASGTGYGHGSTFDSGQDEWNMEKYWAIQKQRDAQLEEVFRGLVQGFRQLFHAHNSPARSIHALSLVDNSSLIPTLDSFLRNDSLLDMARHFLINATVLELVGCMVGPDKAAARALMEDADEQERAVFVGACSLVCERQEGVQTSSLVELLKRLSKQAAVFLKRADVSDGASSGPEAKPVSREARLAKQIVAVYSSVQKRAAQLRNIRAGRFVAASTPKAQVISEPTREIVVETSAGSVVVKTEGAEAASGLENTPVEESQSNVLQQADAAPVVDVAALASEESPVLVQATLPSSKEESSDASTAMESDPADEFYLEVMEELQFDTADTLDASQPDYLVSHYHSEIMSSGAPSQGKIVRLASEQGSLVTSLPLNVSSSVWVVVDENRIDVMRVLISGPEDTPYDAGCFLFDVFFPDTYPKAAPQVNLQTTGHGTVRFNPNLYNCGKVCLSLLGTWHGAANEQWSESTSTVLQVLVSIQSLIFVPRPYFNEPGYESTMNTKTGDVASAQYNDVIRLGTLEHAMLGQLRSPAPGFREVIQSHFAMRRQHIARVVQTWVDECKDGSLRARMQSAFAQLLVEMHALPLPTLDD